jgi:probable rRNA maturation factor
VEVQVDESFAPEVSEEELASAVAAALARGGQADAEVTVVLTDDEAVADLNLRFRGIEGPTDVLSFSAAEPAPGFVMAPEAPPYLGDIVIALPFARRQAADLGRPLRDELRLLAVHGALHLLGYDHAEPAEEAAMWARQDEILAGLTRGA